MGNNFDYCFPKSLIALRPLERRDSSRLLVLNRASGQINHKKFCNLPDYLQSSDCVILNNTKVVPANLKCSLENQKEANVLLLEKIDNNAAKCLVNPARKFKKGAKIFFDNKISAEVIEDFPEKILKFSSTVDLLLETQGRMPLPPYIKREPDGKDFAGYQTVYAKTSGAIAAPTAGLHFTDDIFSKIHNKKIRTAFVTLHVGHGTFKPVRCEDITQHKMHKEWFSAPKETVDLIKDTRKKGGRILAVGTTSCRVLETIAHDMNGSVSGFTDIFIYPPYEFKLTDMLLTNFHQPKSTLLMLVAAFCGYDMMMKAYKEAIEEKYRLFSYGDAMLII